MAKVIKLRSTMQKKEAYLVAGMVKDRQIQNEMYTYCADYFLDNYRAVFFAELDTAKVIFQNAFVTFWEKIDKGIIYVSDDVVMGKDNNPLNGSILTYFMGIARNKYLEWGREHPVYADPETELGRIIREEGFDELTCIDMLYDDGENMMLDIIADVLSQMTSTCYEILTKFYYEEKKLEAILKEMPTFKSKDALKTQKYKCLETLRSSAREIYKRKLNS